MVMAYHAQCDRLRELAGTYPESSFEAALIRQSADTILELRNVGIENAKLRDLLHGFIHLNCYGCGYKGTELCTARGSCRAQCDLMECARSLGIE